MSSISGMNWKDYVKVWDVEAFLKEELAYTLAELGEFEILPEGLPKEAARARVLAKRLEFLADWIEESLDEHS